MGGRARPEMPVGLLAGGLCSVPGVCSYRGTHGHVLSVLEVRHCPRDGRTRLSPSGSHCLPHCEGVRQQLHHLPLGAPKGWPLTAEGARPACCARGEQGCWGAGRALRFASPQLLPALPVVQVGSRAGSAVLAAPCVLSHVWEKARGREGWSESAGVASADRQQVLWAPHCP